MSIKRTVAALSLLGPLTLMAACGTGAALTAGATGPSGATPGTTTSASAPAAGRLIVRPASLTAGHGTNVPRCTGAQIAVRFGDAPSPATGQRGFTLDITDRGLQPCRLSGRPKLAFLGANGSPVGLREDEKGAGGQYVYGAPDAPVVLQPGGTAHVLVTKYRCDSAPEIPAKEVTVAIPGVHHRTELQLAPGTGIGVVAWCGDPQDAGGRTYAVTPFQPGRAP